jgi:hypothetical protein
VFVYSRFVENPSIWYWEINPYFSGGSITVGTRADRGKIHTKAFKNRNNIVSEERLAHIRTIVISLDGKLTYVFFYSTTEMHRQMYVVIFGVLILFCY